MTYTPSINNVILMMDGWKMFWMTHIGTGKCNMLV